MVYINNQLFSTLLHHLAMDLISAIDEIPELEISGYSTSTIPTSSTENDYNLIGNWNDWSPVVDWDKLSDEHHSYFPDLHHYYINDEERLDQSPDSRDSSDCSETNIDNLKGLKLVHLLMAAAESVTKSRDLARVILARLKQLVSTSHGTNMERLAAYFTDGLCNLLESAGGSSKTVISNSNPNEVNRTDKVAAFQLLQDMSPCLKFGHFTANQAIIESVGQDRRIHIVDYDIMEGIQWASLMQALVAKKDCPSTPHLRITAISRGGIGRRSIGTVQETGRRLASFAASIGQPFSFHQCRLESDESFRPSALKLVRGETLLVNCMLHLPHFNHRTSDSIVSFLSGVKSLSPRLVTLVEQVTETTDPSFMGRFMETLHHYSALFDSLEAGFPMQARARALVERVFLGPQINQSLARVYRREEEEESRCWWKWMGSSCGVKAVNISFANNCQAKLLLGLFNDGYKVEEMDNNRLVLGWKSRNLLSASIWTTC